MCIKNQNKNFKKMGKPHSEKYKILLDNVQKRVFIKLKSNKHKINSNEPIFIQEIVRNGPTRIKTSFSNHIHVSNITEIKDSKGILLYPINNKKNKKTMEKKLQNFEGKSISFIYDGCDLPDGSFTPKEIEGKIKSVGTSQFKIDLNKYPGTTLTVSNVQTDTIKTLK